MISSRIAGLRAIEHSDLRQLRDWRNTPSMRRCFREVRELGLVDQERWFSRMQEVTNEQMFAVQRLEDGALVGACGLTSINWVVRCAELSLYIGIDDLYIDEELAPDALDALLRHGFLSLGMNKLWAEVFAFDTRKARLFADVFRFHRDGMLRAAVYENGTYHDSFVFSMLREEFDAMSLAGKACTPNPRQKDHRRGLETPSRAAMHAEREE